MLDINSDVADITLLLKRNAALIVGIVGIGNSALCNKCLPVVSLEEALARLG